MTTKPTHEERASQWLGRRSFEGTINKSEAESLAAQFAEVEDNAIEEDKQSDAAYDRRISELFDALLKKTLKSKWSALWGPELEDLGAVYDRMHALDAALEAESKMRRIEHLETCKRVDERDVRIAALEKALGSLYRNTFSQFGGLDMSDPEKIANHVANELNARENQIDSHQARIAALEAALEKADVLVRCLWLPEEGAPPAAIHAYLEARAKSEKP